MLATSAGLGQDFIGRLCPLNMRLKVADPLFLSIVTKSKHKVWLQLRPGLSTPAADVGDRCKAAPGSTSQLGSCDIHCTRISKGKHEQTREIRWTFGTHI